MNSSHGCRLVVAPHFHLAADWAQRIALAAGLDRTATGLVPLLPWRPAGAEELAALLPDPSRPTAREELVDCLSLFAVAEHLRSRFWDVLALAPEKGEVPAGAFDAFVRELAGFLAFKQLPVPAGAVFDLVVSQPGQTALLDEAPAWGVINMSEDAAWVVLANGPALDRPPIRLRLEPGEGLGLPRAGLAMGHDSSESEQPGVLLIVR
jgi:hypothetical protein